MRLSDCVFVLAAFWVMATCPSHANAVAMEKMELRKLAAVHSAIEDLRSDWKAVPRVGPFQEHRANLHMHSKWSHESRGTIEEIVAAAKKVATSVLMFNEHPADHYDFFKDGHQGTLDGILLVPGAECRMDSCLFLR